MSGTPDPSALLRHHGDVDAEPGLLDFAVNVRAERPPDWLRARLADALDRLGRYPSNADDLAARTAVAARHATTPDRVLVLAGSAEAFSLLPTLRPRLAVVVHPSFTEPEAALRQAGVPVHRVLLSEADGFRLRPDLVPPEADLVVLGNPTNPTSVLHPADAIRSLVRPGRLVVVDEAFLDAVPGEPERSTGPGVLVLRSLTKTWSLAGLRAGYALGEPEVLTALAAHRPQWPVSSLVLEAVTACSRPAAVADAAAEAALLAGYRDDLAKKLAELPGVHVCGQAMAPFLLLRIEEGERVRHRLRERGIAVRRGDTFPGLTTDHVRIAVRAPEVSDVLLAALRAEVGR